MNQNTAQGLAALGRGPDTELVHMTPGEVKSLQHLAMAHGGSLTINPQTGLPEAGFLSSILPMVLGVGAMMIPGLQGLGAAGIAAGIGGLQALRTGSVKDGLLAGLSAYGGAGLAGGLLGAGAAAGAAGTAGAGVPATFSGNLAQAGQGLTALPSSEAARTAFMGNAASKGVEATGVGGGKGLMKLGLAAASPMMVPTVTQQPEIKADKDMGQRYGYLPGAVGPTPAPDVPGYGNQGENFGREQTYFNPKYAPISDEQAKNIYGFAGGGPVEDMSNANAIGANTGYPQSSIRTSAYAAPFQQPASQNIVAGAQDVAVDPYTGQEQRTGPAPQAQFADGGYVYNPNTFLFSRQGAPSPTSENDGIGGYTYDPATGKYAKIDPIPLIQQAVDEKAMNPYTSGDADYSGPQSQGYVTGVTSATTGYGNPGESESISDAAASQSAGENVGGEGPSGSGVSLARGGLAALARGGISHLGDYSDGGRLLRGPGDGVSDDIPAMIGKKQPARLADGEFVVPARIVSELGNGSTEAGARKLYAMMERVQKARGKTVGKGKVATNSRAEKHLPA